MRTNVFASNQILWLLRKYEYILSDEIVTLEMEITTKRLVYFKMESPLSLNAIN